MSLLFADDPATSYASVDDADTVAARQPTVVRAAWEVLGDDPKQAALDATALELDALADDPGFVDGVADDADLLAKLVAANALYAVLVAPAYADDAAVDSFNADPGNGNIKVDQVGPIRTEYFEAQTSDVSSDPLAAIPRQVRAILRGLLLSVSANTWGSGTASRGS